MYNNAYFDPDYKELQSKITKENWKRGIYDFKVKSLVSRHCKNPNCNNTFKVKPYDPKHFCSRSCSIHVSNLNRKQSVDTRSKISKAISLLPKSFFQRSPLPKIILVCQACGKEFGVVPYLARSRKFCSVHCSITTTGHKTTSPKASKGKSGVREDIDINICFYSTWEANVARVFNLVKLKWIYAPKIFDLGEHTYRPDFYLPGFNTYIEVKNFMGEYSLNRHNNFKKLYPNLKLELIMKNEYKQIKENYKYFITNWEY